MPNGYFAFKQFRIGQQGAAMKVGTDGVLLGAWMRLNGTEERILDIGTGTGLLALMAAQRVPCARLDAVEMDEGAAEQARQNALDSPWADRIGIFTTSVQDFSRHTGFRYDHIVSNPPYFVRSLKAAGRSRTTARHADSLSFEELIAAVLVLLKPEGRFSVIYPTPEAVRFEAAAGSCGLYCNHKTIVKGTPEAPGKRMLMEFSRHQTPACEDKLIIELSRHCYSAEYIALTKDFYLKF